MTAPKSSKAEPEIDRLELETCTVDIVRRVVRGAEGLVRLSPMEARLVAYLAARPGVTVSREELLREVWGYREGVVSRTLDTTIRTLRSKVEADRTTPSHILTDPGGGYRFEHARPAPGVAAPEPPPVPLAAVNEPNVFIGRVDDLHQLEARYVAGARLVTLVGPAGVGKTRLARRAARNLLSRGAFPAGIRVADLMAASGADDALHAVALAAHPDSAPRLTVEAIGVLLAGLGPALLVLDNADNVVEPLSRFLTTWLDLAPELRILVTSRERLRLRAEQCQGLDPLPQEDGVALLRARAASGGVTFDPQGEECLVELVRRLEGLPLGLELAAARIPALGPRGVLERLALGFSFLGDDARDVPARHTSLHRAIQASWDLLPSWARDAWMQVSVFGGGFDLQAALAVVDLSRYTNAPPVEQVLDMLAERCLIRRSTSSELRFGFFESMRSFARKRLDLAERRSAVELRHAGYYLKLAEAMVSSQESVWFTLTVRPQPKLEAERSNLLAAWATLALRGPADLTARLAVVLWTGALTLPLDARIEVAEQARPRLDQMSKAWRCRTLLLLSALRIAAGRDDDALLDTQRALDLATELSDDALRAEAYDLRSRIHLHGTRLKEALADGEAALSLVHELHDPLRRAMLLLQMATTRVDAAWLTFSATQAAAAEDAFTRALALFRRTRYPEGQGWTLARLGSLLATQERIDEARVCVDDGLRLSAAMAGAPLHTEVVLLRGEVAGVEGDDALAHASLHHAWDVAAPMQDRRVACRAALTTAALLLIGEDAHPALAELDRADALFEGNHMSRERATGSLLRGAAECLAGRPTSAVASLVGAEEATGADPRVATAALGVTAWAHLALGRMSMARAAATEVRARTTRGSPEDRTAALIEATAAWVGTPPGPPREEALKKLESVFQTLTTPRPRTLQPPEVALGVIRALVERLLRGRAG
jgi:predicted ATPase/DNA-binding winged helix-turn-helix (wHTH) protein